MMDRSPTSTQPAPYGLDHEHNGLWLKIVLEALKEYALARDGVLDNNPQPKRDERDAEAIR